MTALAGVFADEVSVGDALPQLEIEVTPTLVIATAIATRDFERVHHDKDHAQSVGMKDVFLNILTTNGLCVRLVTDWAGPNAIIKKTNIRLGVTCYAGDTLMLSGEVVSREGDLVEVNVAGRCSLGDHVTGTVTADLGRPA